MESWRSRSRNVVFGDTILAESDVKSTSTVEASMEMDNVCKVGNRRRRSNPADVTDPWSQLVVDKLIKMYVMNGIF